MPGRRPARTYRVPHHGRHAAPLPVLPDADGAPREAVRGRRPAQALQRPAFLVGHQRHRGRFPRNGRNAAGRSRASPLPPSLRPRRWTGPPGPPLTRLRPGAAAREGRARPPRAAAGPGRAEGSVPVGVTGLEAALVQPAEVAHGSRSGWVTAPSAAARPSRSPAVVWCRRSHCAGFSSPLAPFNLLVGKTTRCASPLSVSLSSSLNLLQSVLKAVGGPGSRPGSPEALTQQGLQQQDGSASRAPRSLLGARAGVRGSQEKRLGERAPRASPQTQGAQPAPEDSPAFPQEAANLAGRRKQMRLHVKAVAFSRAALDSLTPLWMSITGCTGGAGNKACF